MELFSPVLFLLQLLYLLQLLCHQFLLLFGGEFLGGLDALVAEAGGWGFRGFEADFRQMLDELVHGTETNQ